MRRHLPHDEYIVEELESRMEASRGNGLGFMVDLIKFVSLEFDDIHFVNFCDTFYNSMGVDKPSGELLQELTIILTRPLDEVMNLEDKILFAWFLTGADMLGGWIDSKLKHSELEVNEKNKRDFFEYLVDFEIGVVGVQ